MTRRTRVGALWACVAFASSATSATLAACDGCHDEPVDHGAGGHVGLRAPEPWTMGAADQGTTLPPPCRVRGDSLRTVLVREARLTTARGVLNRVFVAEGATPHGLPPSAWQHDDAGLMRPEHGRGHISAVPWSEHGTPRFARAGEGWLALIQRPGGLALWHAPRADEQHFERLSPNPALTGADLRCEGTSCALLTSRVDATGAVVAGNSGATFWFGASDEPAASWQRVDLAAPDGRHTVPLTIASLSAAHALVALTDPLRVRFVDIRDGERGETLAALSAPHGALDASVLEGAAGPRPAALIHTTTPGAGCGELEAGGVGMALLGAPPRQLRSATPAISASLSPLSGGMIAVWLAPARCDSPRNQLHAAVLRADGTPVAPVTAIGEADGFALATRGSDVDLWIRRWHNGQSTTVSWIRATCSLPGSADETDGNSAQGGDVPSP